MGTMIDNPVCEKFRVPESNVFLMTRFSETAYHAEVSKAVADSVHAFGLEFVRADDLNWSAPTLWERVQSCLDACHFGVAIFESIDRPDFNPNVSLELGYMMALKRQCLLLKEQRLERLPTDLCGHMYKEFDSRDIRPTVLGRVADWLKEIGVRKRDGETVVVFVSKGGTCRCALAKAITRSLLRFNKDWADIRVESRAAGKPSLPTATQAAIRVAHSRLDEDWLSEHRPRRAGVGFLYEADLILATDRKVLEGVQNSFVDYPGTDEDKVLVQNEIRSKTHLLTEFFGGSGDVKDPWPDRGDDSSLLEYEQCVNVLYSVISNGLDRLADFLEKAALNSAMKRPVAFGACLLSP
jgi:protein-tyrosine-phosphatase